MAQLEQQEFVSNCCYFLCDTPGIRFKIGLELSCYLPTDFTHFKNERKKTKFT